MKEKDAEYSINRNMRCIEIYYTMTEKDAEYSINRNMRCIEIMLPIREYLPGEGLIET